jgi:hypothetical protein
VTATNKKISLKPQTLQTVGEYFVKASEVDPAAWSAALTIAAYKSQNISLPPAGPVMSRRQMPASHIYYVEPWLMLPPANFNEFPADRGIPVTYELLGPEVPAESGAIAQLISAPGLGLLKDGRGPQYVYIETSAHMVLDEWDLKNIIFVGAHIVYRGGPSILENISYINCDFDIVPNDKGKQFVSSIFGPVTLGTSQKDVIP